MRILMVVRPAAGGMKEHLLALSAGVIGARHEVEVAAPLASDVAEAARRAGLPVHEIPLAGPLHPVSDPRAILALRALVNAGHFDLVHAHGFKAGLVARLGVRVSGVVPRPPVVVTAHNHVLFRDDTPAWARARYRFVERSLSGLVARYIAVSRSIARELVEGYGLPAERVEVVYNGVDPAPFRALPERSAARAALGLDRPDADVVGLAARFSAQKGLRHLVAAAPLIRDARRADGRELVVAIGGSGPLEAELREQAVAAGAASTVRWLGHVDSMPELLSALDVYVSPAETEALGIGLIEAALAGVPTVATDVGGVAEVVLDGTTGVLVPSRDPRALADAVISLLRDPERASELAAAARQRCLEQFAPQRMLERTLDVYAMVLGEAAVNSSRRPKGPA